jgi:hypothetical protein
MTLSPSSPAWLLLLLAAAAVSGCGGSRHLQSVSLSPAVADAQSFPNGQAVFTATGTFSKPPSPETLTSKDVLWCVGGSDGTCVGNAIPGATVDQNGLAQCNAAFTGTVIVLAGKTSSTMGIPDSGAKLDVFGSAQLTCP